MKTFQVIIKGDRESYNGYNITEKVTFIVEARNSESAFNKALKLARISSNAYTYQPFSATEIKNDYR